MDASPGRQTVVLGERWCSSVGVRDTGEGELGRRG